MIYRGVEDIYGNVFQFVDGIFISGNQAYIDYEPDTYENTGKHKPIGYVNTSGQGYISKIGYDYYNDLVQFPTESSGESGTYITDYYWLISGSKVLLVGGAYSYGLNCGLWSWNAHNTTSFANNMASARLIKTN